MSDESNVTTVDLSSPAPEAIEETPVAVEGVVNTEAPVDNEDLFSSRFAALSKREKRMVDAQAEIKAQEAKFNDMNSAVEGGAMEILKYHGLSIDDVISHALGEDAPKEEVDPNTALREEFEAYKQSIEDKETKRLADIENQNQSSIDDAINNHKQTISSHISQNPEKYELISNQGEHELVWEVTQANFDNTGEILTAEEAADKVEAYLEGKVREMLKLKKFSTNPQSEQIKDNNFGTIESPTLTQRNTTQTTTGQRALTREESLKQAAANLKWR